MRSETLFIACTQSSLGKSYVPKSHRSRGLKNRAPASEELAATPFFRSWGRAGARAFMPSPSRHRPAAHNPHPDKAHYSLETAGQAHLRLQDFTYDCPTAGAGLLLPGRSLAYPRPAGTAESLVTADTSSTFWGVGGCGASINARNVDDPDIFGGGKAQRPTDTLTFCAVTNLPN